MDPLASFRLDGRTAVVTGASSGLGARFAHVLHGAGARVIAAARRVERVEKLVASLPGAEAVGCDVTDDGDLARLMSVAGDVDVLVNNAGVNDRVPAEDEDLDEFRRVVETNLVGAFRLTQLAATGMLARGSGSVINIASILGVVGVGQIPQAGYAASKAGMIGLTKELAAQWARRGVRVNAIAPGWFPSEMTGEMTTSEEEGLRWIRSRDPMGRPGREEELDGALLFLASDASTYVTGQVIAVDGGWTAI